MTVELSTFITCDNNGSNKHFLFNKKDFTTTGHMEIHTYNTYSILNNNDRDSNVEFTTGHNTIVHVYIYSVSVYCE